MPPVTVLLSGDLYTSEQNGSDADGDGTSDKPFKTIMQVRPNHNHTISTDYTNRLNHSQIHTYALLGAPFCDQLFGK